MQPLHGDWKKPRPDFPKVHLVNSIWALDDLCKENGAPRIIPGTHLRPELPEDVLEDTEATHPQEVYLECPAGSIMIFNAHTWHGGTINYIALADVFCMACMYQLMVCNNKIRESGYAQKQHLD